MKKMKRILVALLSCTMAFACVAGLSACDQPTSSSSPAASSSSEVTDSSSSDSTPAECAHSGGTATCTELAECENCGEAYGELAAHVWVENAGSPESCTENGTKAHFECENCDAVSLDGENATEESLVIEATGHTWGELGGDVEETCTMPGTKAHYACECGAVALDQEVEGETQKVEVEAEDLVIEAKGHAWGELIPETHENPCYATGTKAHYDCENCDAVAVDGEEDAKVEVAAEEIVIAKVGHQWAGKLGQEVSCTQDGYPAHFVCTVCEAQSLDRKSEVCIRVEPATGHNWVGDLGKPATCQAEGVRAHWLCTNCGIVSLEKDGAPVDLLPIPVDADAFHANVLNLTREDGLPQDCENPGYTEYYVCNVCGDIVSGKEEIPADGHDWKAVDFVQPTCQKDGNIAHYACACGAVSLDGENVTTENVVLVKMDQHMCVEEGYVKAVAATCQPGKKAYYVCGFDDCDAIVVVENDEKVNVEDEEYLVVYPTDDEILAYHLANNTYVLGHNATCDKDGNIEHYTCAVCEGTFDKSGAKVDAKIPATGHDRENLVNLYDLAKEECLKAGCPVDGLYYVLNYFFPNGRNADGYYCELGPVCANCFDVFAYFVIDEDNGTVSLGEIKGYALTGIGHDGGKATCSTYAVCDRCGFEWGDYADVTDAANHNYIYDLDAEYGKPGVAATCEEDGAYKLAQCTDCKAYAAVISEDYVYVGFELDTEEAKEIITIPADATNVDYHSWYSDYENKIGAAGRPEANCTDPALYKVDVCSICGQNAKYVEDHYEFLAEGWTDEDRIAIPAYNHTKDGVSTIVDATCTADAYCTLCNASGKALGEDADLVAHHVWAEELTVEEEPVCGEVTVNKSHYACVRCDDQVKLEDGTVVAYSEANYVVREHHIVDATCTADAYCDNEGCGASGADLGENADYLAHHVWSATSKANMQPTCLEAGWVKYWTCVCTCCEDGCDAIRKEVDGGYAEGTNADTNEDGIIDFIYVAPLGHDFTAEDNSNLVKGWAYSCNPDDTFNGQKDYYTCVNDNCDVKSLDQKNAIESDEELVIVAEHTWGDLQETKKTCTTTGLKPHYVCSGCGSYTEDKETLVEYDSLIVPESHEYGEWIEKDPEDCQNDGFEAHYYCVECDKYFDADKNEVSKESLVIVKGPHVCAHPERYCSDYVNCDVCGNAFKYDDRDESLYASHKWNGNGECKFCDAVKDAPVVDNEGSTDGE